MFNLHFWRFLQIHPTISWYSSMFLGLCFFVHCRLLLWWWTKKRDLNIIWKKWNTSMVHINTFSTQCFGENTYFLLLQPQTADCFQDPLCEQTVWRHEVTLVSHRMDKQPWFQKPQHHMLCDYTVKKIWYFNGKRL